MRKSCLKGFVDFLLLLYLRSPLSLHCDDLGFFRSFATKLKYPDLTFLFSFLFGQQFLKVVAKGILDILFKVLKVFVFKNCFSPFQATILSKYFGNEQLNNTGPVRKDLYKRNLISSVTHFIYELPHELPNKNIRK